MKKRTEVTIEIEREIIITKSGNNRSWCSVCGKQLQMLTAGETAQVMKTSESVVYQLAESGVLHFTTTNEGMLLICPASFADLTADDQTMPLPRRLTTDGQVLLD